MRRNIDNLSLEMRVRLIIATNKRIEHDAKIRLIEVVVISTLLSFIVHIGDCS